MAASCQGSCATAHGLVFAEGPRRCCHGRAWGLTGQMKVVQPNCSLDLVQSVNLPLYAGDAMFGLAATAAVAAAIVIPFELGRFGKARQKGP